MLKAYLCFISIICICFVSGCNLITNAKTQKIYDDGVNYFRLSPNQDKLLIVTKQKEILIYDIATQKICFNTRENDDEFLITDIDWYNNSTFLVARKVNRSNLRGRFLTEDFKTFIMFHELKEEQKVYFSKKYKKILLQDVNTNKIFVKYENGEIWDLDLHFKFTGISWSNDDRYLFLSDGKSNYLLNTDKRIIHELDKDFSGYWALNKNIYAFTTNLGAYNFKDHGLYIFNPDDLSFTKFNTDGMQTGGRLIWSPDSKYIALVNVKGIFIFDTQNPQALGKELFNRTNEELSEKYADWSVDSKFILALYGVRTPNPYQPRIYYVTKIDIATGRVWRIRLKEEPDFKFIWVDNDTIIYRPAFGEGLYRTDLNW